MGTKYKNKRTAGYISAIIPGLLVMVTILILCISVTAFFVIEDRVPESAAEHVAPLIQFVSVFAGSYMAGRREEKSFVAVSVITSIIYYVFLIAITILAFGGVFQNVVASTVAAFVGTALAIVVRLRQNSGRPSKKRRTFAC